MRGSLRGFIAAFRQDRGGWRPRGSVEFCNGACAGRRQCHFFRQRYRKQNKVSGAAAAPPTRRSPLCCRRRLRYQPYCPPHPRPPRSGCSAALPRFCGFEVPFNSSKADSARALTASPLPWVRGCRTALPAGTGASRPQLLPSFPAPPRPCAPFVPLVPSPCQRGSGQQRQGRKHGCHNGLLAGKLLCFFASLQGGATSCRRCPRGPARGSPRCRLVAPAAGCSLTTSVAVDGDKGLGMASAQKLLLRPAGGGGGSVSATQAATVASAAPLSALAQGQCWAVVGSITLFTSWMAVTGKLQAQQSVKMRAIRKVRKGSRGTTGVCIWRLDPSPSLLAATTGCMQAAPRDQHCLRSWHAPAITSIQAAAAAGSALLWIHMLTRQSLHDHGWPPRPLPGRLQHGGRTRGVHSVVLLS